MSPASGIETAGYGPPLTATDLSYLIATAGRAPSVHNTQPWKFRTADGAVELLADPDRRLPCLDPAGREQMISCGAALYGLRLAFRGLGRLAVVQVLPDPAEPLLIARLQPGARQAITAAEKELLTALPHRHTHRGPFTPGDISARLLAALQDDAAAEGSELTFVADGGIVAALSGLVTQAAAEQRGSAAINAELCRWAPSAGSQRKDGVPAQARRGPGRTGGQAAGRPAAAGSGQPRLPVRDFGQPGSEQPGSEQPGSEQAGGAAPGQTAVLATSADTVTDWLNAGQALHRLLLRAATRWVFASLHTQPLESPRHREQVRELLGLTGYPQMLLQFGRSNTAASTPRRPPTELLA